MRLLFDKNAVWPSTLFFFLVAEIGPWRLGNIFRLEEKIAAGETGLEEELASLRGVKSKEGMTTPTGQHLSLGDVVRFSTPGTEPKVGFIRDFEKGEKYPVRVETPGGRSWFFEPGEVELHPDIRERTVHEKNATMTEPSAGTSSADYAKQDAPEPNMNGDEEEDKENPTRLPRRRRSHTRI